MLFAKETRIREIILSRVCAFVCFVNPLILDVRFVDVPAGVTQEEGHTRFVHLPPVGLAFIFIARRIQSLLPLVVREAGFPVFVCVCFLPIYSGRHGRISRGHPGGRSHRIFHPPSFCGACLDFSPEKDSAVSFVDREVEFVCVCVCVFIKLHITTQSGPVILVILCHSH